jgi:hypothetical protein
LILYARGSSVRQTKEIRSVVDSVKDSSSMSVPMSWIGNLSSAVIAPKVAEARALTVSFTHVRPVSGPSVMSDKWHRGVERILLKEEGAQVMERDLHGQLALIKMEIGRGLEAYQSIHQYFADALCKLRFPMITTRE